LADDLVPVTAVGLGIRIMWRSVFVPGVPYDANPSAENGFVAKMLRGNVFCRRANGTCHPESEFC
jgi:hypothetical protein